MALTIVTGLAATAHTQVIGTFHWQQEPYCNVVTLTVIQVEGVFHLDGFDDQCGAGTRGAAVGVAVANPNGTIGMGLTIVTTPGGTPLHLDTTLSLVDLAGSWRDSSGATGAWTLVTATASDGNPRPRARAPFPDGVSLGGSTITSVGTPVNPDDAATKGYVDAGVTSASATAVTQAVAQAVPQAVAQAVAETRALLTAPLNMTAYSATVRGTTFDYGYGCLGFDAAAVNLALDLPLPIGARVTGLKFKYSDTADTNGFLFVLAGLDFENGSLTEGRTFTAVSPNGSVGSRIDSYTFSPTLPVSEKRSYALKVTAPSGNSLQFCGAIVTYTMP